MNTVSQPTQTKIDESPKVSFRVSRELRQRIKVFAASNEITIEALMLEAATRFMDSATKPSRARAS